jgi:5-methylcytosine-specific restriction endonuclease McrA
LEQFPKQGKSKSGRQQYRNQCRACFAAYIARWFREEPGAQAIRARKSNKRRATKLQLPHVPYDVFEIYERDGGTCSLCGEPCEKYKPNGHRAFDIEHVVPLQVDTVLLPSFGIAEHPGDVPWNVTVAHRSCNTSKGNRMTQADADNYFVLRDTYKEQHDTP